MHFFFFFFFFFKVHFAQHHALILFYLALLHKEQMRHEMTSFRFSHKPLQANYPSVFKIYS